MIQCEVSVVSSVQSYQPAEYRYWFNKCLYYMYGPAIVEYSMIVRVDELSGWQSDYDPAPGPGVECHCLTLSPSVPQADLRLKMYKNMYSHHTTPHHITEL